MLLLSRNMSITKVQILTICQELFRFMLINTILKRGQDIVRNMFDNILKRVHYMPPELVSFIP